jgi:hypothetical protein
VRRVQRRVPAAVALLVCLSAVQGCGTSSGPEGSTGRTATGVASRTPAVLFDFEDIGTGPTTTVANRGSLRGEAKAMAVNGGRVTPQAGPDGEAVRFPANDTSAAPQRAVLVYGSGDGGLDPRDDDFRFGADFVLDAVAQGGDDNGNNLVQRGLAADPTQYKLQAENGVASCRVAGDLGELTVKSRTRVEPGVWYRATCARSGDQVSLALRALDGGPVDRTYRQGTIGSLTCKASVPLVIGGKLAPDGTVVRRSSDQLNGALDNVFVTLR